MTTSIFHGGHVTDGANQNESTTLHGLWRSWALEKSRASATSYKTITSTHRNNFISIAHTRPDVLFIYIAFIDCVCVSIRNLVNMDCMHILYSQLKNPMIVGRVLKTHRFQVADQK